MAPGTCGPLLLGKVAPSILLRPENSGGRPLWVSLPLTDNPLERKPLNEAELKEGETSRF